MPIYQLRGTTVTAHARVPSEIADDATILESRDQLANANLPMADLVRIWNSLPGVTPVTKFKDRKIGVQRLWAAFERLSPAELPVAEKEPADDSAGDAPRISKQDQVITMLRAEGGTTLDQIMAATGWQRHTVRGLISGALKKKRGLAVLSEKAPDGARLYRIAEGATIAGEDN
ncbi:MAG: hypothetical protein JWL84_1837 [Rhodospirillales bacterium]|nr:hypothetical protein [Rhodospirillales bacterium]